MKTETLTSNSKETKEATSSIDDLLSGYETMEESEETEEIDDDGDGYSTDEKISSDKSDSSLYFQSGKKKGQLKPKGRDILGGEVKATVDPSPKAIKGSNILSGLMLLTLVDLIFPLLLQVANNKFSKVKIKASDLRIKKTQKNELEPLANMVVESLNIEANPIQMFAVSMIGVYGLNLVEARNM